MELSRPFWTRFYELTSPYDYHPFISSFNPLVPTSLPLPFIHPSPLFPASIFQLDCLISIIIVLAHQWRIYTRAYPGICPGISSPCTGIRKSSGWQPRTRTTHEYTVLSRYSLVEAQRNGLLTRTAS